ncbi:hypothetical protein CCMA1212_004679 [Trichoderma ghanense]|uniref:Uncharacterized protein n=1 Tax=Trichoderma ghanense TaxID=65468 RepID=A0ABY2H6U9_9HYPO
MEAESAPATRCAGWATGASAPASHSPATGGERGAGRLLEPFWANQRTPGRRLKKQAATSQPSRWLLPIFAAPLDVSERSFQLHVPHLPALKFVPATEDVVVARRVLRCCVPCAEDALAPEALPLTSAVAPALQALSHSLSLPSLSCSGAALRNRQFGGHLPSQSPPQRERVTQPTQRCCIHSLPGVKVAIPLPPRRQAVTSSRRLASAPKPPGHAAKSHISLVAVINTKHAACRCPAASQRPAPQPVPAYSISMIPGPDSTLAASL